MRVGRGNPPQSGKGYSPVFPSYAQRGPRASRRAGWAAGTRGCTRTRTYSCAAPPARRAQASRGTLAPTESSCCCAGGGEGGGGGARIFSLPEGGARSEGDGWRAAITVADLTYTVCLNCLLRELTARFVKTFVFDLERYRWCRSPLCCSRQATCSATGSEGREVPSDSGEPHALERVQYLLLPVKVEDARR